MDENVLNEYSEAMKRVTENPDFQKDMAALYYTSLSADEVDVAASQSYIYDKREMCRQIIEKAPDLDSLTQ
jgi:tripartite-type tricarboxylate transporter receptor subunit TctC